MALIWLLIINVTIFIVILPYMFNVNNKNDCCFLANSDTGVYLLIVYTKHVFNIKSQ